MKEKWTASLVELRYDEAAKTLRRLPRVKVQGYFSAWPTIVYDAQEAYGWEPQLLRRGPPTQQAISRTEETIEWHRFLDVDENRLVWLRANDVYWKQICWRIGCGRTTAWQRWVTALQKVTIMLNGLEIPVRVPDKNEHANS